MIKVIINSLALVYKETSYIIITFVLYVVLWFLAIVLPNISYILNILSNNYFNFEQRIRFAYLYIYIFQNSLTLWDKTILSVVTSLGAINVSFFIFYFRRRLVAEKSVGSGFFGIMIGLLGVGCSACGSVFLASFLGLSISVSFLNFLPFGGKELGILGVVIILISIYLLAKKITNPLVCRIK